MQRRGQREEVLAIEQFLLSCTVPLVLELEHRTGLLGTGTLFTVGGRYFIITASHIFEGKVDVNSIGVPLNTRRAEIVTFGPSTIYRPLLKSIDVAVIELRDPPRIAQFEEEYRFLTTNHLGRFHPTQTTFVIAGYPEALSSESAEWLISKPTTFVTSYLPRPPSSVVLTEPIDPQFDLFFDYRREAEKLNGNAIATPALEGVSGASVWAFDRGATASTAVWLPELQIKIIAIQSGYAHSAFVRAKNWAAVAVLFGNIDEELARLVQHRYFDQT
jgi:hypothetical protein